MEKDIDKVRELAVPEKYFPAVNNVYQNPKGEIFASKSQEEKCYSSKQSKGIDKDDGKSTSKIPRLIGGYSTINKVSCSPNRVYQLKTKGTFSEVETKPTVSASNVNVANRLSNINMRTKPNLPALNDTITHKYGMELVSQTDNQFGNQTKCPKPIINLATKTIEAELNDILGYTHGDGIPIIYHFQKKYHGMEKTLKKVESPKGEKSAVVVEQIMKKPILSDIQHGYTHSSSPTVNAIMPSFDNILKGLSEENDEKNPNEVEMQKTLFCNSLEDKDEYINCGTCKDILPESSEIFLSEHEENYSKKEKHVKKMSLKVFLLLIFILTILLLFICSGVDDCKLRYKNYINLLSKVMLNMQIVHETLHDVFEKIFVYVKVE